VVCGVVWGTGWGGWLTVRVLTGLESLCRYDIKTCAFKLLHFLFVVYE
jgi:hypothetical protein